MSHSISISDELYEIAKEEATLGCRTISKQIEYWSKEARAARLVEGNKWLDMYNARILIDRMDSKDVIEVKDVEGFLREIRGE